MAEKKRESTSSSIKSTRSSSFFARIRNSFVRINGNHGTDVKTLRGTRGADFENVGRISRGGGILSDFGCLFCLIGRRAGDDSSHKERFLLIKGPSLFVFSDQDAPSPKYAVPLLGMQARIIHNLTTVLLENNLGDLQYEVHFDNHPDIATQFCDTVKAQASAAQTEETRKQLGHEKLLNKRTSHLHAAAVAKKKEKDQPDAPVSSEDVMKNMPVNAM